MTHAEGKSGSFINIRHIILAAFFIRLLLIIITIAVYKDLAIFRSLDTEKYLRPAKELVFYGRFADYSVPNLSRAPGYPILLIPGILFGHIELITICLQILLSLLTVYLVFKIGLIIFEDERTAKLCAFLYALEPLSIFFTSMLMTETLFTCALMLFLYYLLKYMKTGSLKDLLISSVSLAGCAYIRPVSYFLPAFAAIFFLAYGFKKRRAHNFKKSVIYICVFFLVSMGLIGLWQIRNKIVAGYSRFSAISDCNLYFWEGASVLAARDDSPVYFSQRQLAQADEIISFLNYPKRLSKYQAEKYRYLQSEKYRYMRREGIKIIAENPVLYLRLYLNGMFRTLFEPGAFDYLKLFKLYPQRTALTSFSIKEGLARTMVKLFRERPLVFWGNLIFESILLSYFFFMFVGLAPKKITANISIQLILCVAVYLLVLSSGGCSQSRFRHPIMPMVCLIAGSGLSHLVDKFKKMHADR